MIWAIFCIFDIVLWWDVWVEICIPGGTNVYAVDEENMKYPIEEFHWNFVFMSSILWSFNPTPAPALKIVKELDNKELFKDFLLVATNLHKGDFSSKFGEIMDKAKGGNSFLIQQIV